MQRTLCGPLRLCDFAVNTPAVKPWIGPVPFLRSLILLTALVLGAGPAVAQKEAPPAPGTPKDFRLPPRRSFTLPDGMQVTLVRYGVIPKVNVTLTVRTGQIDEKPDEVQLAGLTADMLVEGTTTRSAADISRQAAEMGGTLGTFASSDAVTIGGEVLSEFGERYLALVADVAQRPKFAPADVERLRANRARNNAINLSSPGEQTRVRFRELIFPDHPYGRSYPTEAMLSGYTADKVRAFYQRTYGARRAHLYVSGVFDQARMERALRTAFATWPAGPAATLNPPTPVARRQVDLIDRPDAVQSSLRVGLPVADPTNPDWIRLNVADAILGGAFGSRITSNIREDKGYTYSPFSFVASYPKTGIWLEVADVTTKVTGPSLKEIFYEIDRLRTEAPPEAELTGIKNNIVGLFTIRNSSRGGVIGQLQFVDQHRLGEAYLSSYVKNVMAVTPEQVRQMAVKYFDPAKMSIAVVGDKKVVDEQLAPYRAGVP